MHLKKVHQFLAWGRRAAAEGMDGLDYILMPDLGEHYDKVGLTKSEAEDYMYKARDRYEKDDGMKHAYVFLAFGWSKSLTVVHSDAHLGNALFKKVGNTIVCHLVDWLWADDGGTHFDNPGEPITISLADCVFDPWATNSDSEETASSEGYMGDRSSPPGPHH